MKHGDLRPTFVWRAQEERRSGSERRSGKDTRTNAAKQLLGEKRSGKDRRSGLDRRKQYLINYRLTLLYRDGREGVERLGQMMVAYGDAVDPVAQFERDFADNYESDPECDPVLDVYYVQEISPDTLS